jgi:DNA repair exonuclease SbcCD nuclease subunit
VAYGTAEAGPLASSAVDYWALGGEHERRALLAGPITAHYCGTPQGRRPQEAGPRGCTLVEVDESRRVRTSFLTTDALRYERQRVMVAESTTTDQLQQILNERSTELAADPFGPDLLVQWTIAGSRALARELATGKLAADLVARLRAQHGAGKPVVWTVEIQADQAASVPRGLYDEESIIGEFLRTVRSYGEHPEAKLNVEPYLAERHLAGSLGELVAINDPAVRRRVLGEAARLGMELLSPQEREA